MFFEMVCTLRKNCLVKKLKTCFFSDFVLDISYLITSPLSFITINCQQGPIIRLEKVSSWAVDENDDKNNDDGDDEEEEDGVC